MSFRNQSPQHMFLQMALEHKPSHVFAGITPEDFTAWKEETYPRVIATLGDFPGTVPLDPMLTAEWEHDGLRKQRWLINVGPHISASFLVNIPKDAGENEKLPAIQCWHGHGKFGKEPVMGNDSNPEVRAEKDYFNYGYGHDMAKAGFVTYAIDWMGMGERNDGRKPNWRNNDWGRDWCNLYYLHATMLGMTSISINLAQGMAATDFACTLPNVDPDRLGVMGLSGGGTMTTWTALYDKRIKAAEIICYTDLWAYFGFRDFNYCGMQVAPGLYKLVDLPDLQGLIAPMPLLVDIGAYDSCFYIDTAMASYRHIEEIYAAAGVPEKLELDLAPREHGWCGNKSVEFFRKYL